MTLFEKVSSVLTGASPYKYLIFAMFIYSLLFVESLKASIMALVQSPCVDLDDENNKFNMKIAFILRTHQFKQR